jgi:hypothetical protein
VATRRRLTVRLPSVLEFSETRVFLSRCLSVWAGVARSLVLYGGFFVQQLVTAASRAIVNACSAAPPCAFGQGGEPATSGLASPAGPKKGMPPRRARSRGLTPKSHPSAGPATGRCACDWRRPRRWGLRDQYDAGEIVWRGAESSSGRGGWGSSVARGLATSDTRVLEHFRPESRAHSPRRMIRPRSAIVDFQTAPIPRCYLSLLLRVSIHGTMMPKRIAKRIDVSQSIVLAP